MCCCGGIAEKIKKLTVCDLVVLKVCVLAFALAVAKVWPQVLGLDWRWYAGVFTATYLYLVYKVFMKK